MKFVVLAVFALLAVANARNIGVDVEDLTAYDYLAKIGLPLAEEIRKAEEEEQSSRIAGGTAVTAPSQIPYQAGLLAQFWGGQGVCGGVLVRPNRVLTAAHCWWDGVNQATSFIVVLGSTTLFSGGTRINTNNVVMHNQWNTNLIRNDIAMIRLPSNVPLTTNINTVALPSGSQLNLNFAGHDGVASGYGRTGDSASGAITTSQSLRQVTLPIITNAVCMMSFPFNVVASNICTSGAGGRSTCGGDSGGPLVVTINSQRVLVGLTSFGSIRGCQQGFPAAFVRVTSFISWINSNL